MHSAGGILLARVESDHPVRLAVEYLERGWVRNEWERRKCMKKRGSVVCFAFVTIFSLVSVAYHARHDRNLCSRLRVLVYDSKQ